MTLYLGIDIGGTKIAGGLVTEEGRILRSARVPTPLTGGEAILAAALDLARALLAEAPETVASIGIGTGGQVDVERGFVVSASDLLPGWAGIAVTAAFEDAFGLPAFVDNDVNALAAGESRFGAGRGLGTVVFLALGTGVGGALLLHGRLHHGAHWTGGEFGYLLLTTDMTARRKTLEDLAGGPGLVKTWREMTSSEAPMTGEEIAAEAVRDPDGPAARAVTRTGEHLGFGLASLANALDPDLIVIGGGLAALGDTLLDPARRILGQFALPHLAHCPVVLAALGRDAALVGAASLAMPPARPTRAEREAEGQIALVPLDERPVNTRYPQMLGAIGGAAVRLPPPEIRGLQRVPADTEAVAAWLREAARQADAAIVSCEFLGCGNLINARISQDSAADVLARLRLLAELNPSCPVHAFSLITRVSNADDAVEEPDYWAEWGTTFYRYARLAHQAELGVRDDGEELARLEALLPTDLKADWLARRLRNHTVNLGLLDMTARGQITSLRLTSDDTSPYGFPSRERDWLRGWPRLLGLALSDRVMMHPGADEVGSALLSHLLMTRAGRTPRVGIVLSHPEDAGLVAPYEDRPIRETIEGQILACGGVVADRADRLEGCDFVLGVATPCPRRADYRPEYLAEDRATRTAAYQSFLAELARWQERGVPVALADVAYPNGSDPLLTEMLLSETALLAPGRLAAYGAWNTAGNTLGVVVAQAACAGLVGDDSERAQAQRIFLAHRFLEDWGYQTVTRREARAEAERRWGRREPDPNSPEELAALCGFIEQRLQVHLTTLSARGIGEELALAPGSVRLPWRRTFEVDFALVSPQEGPGIGVLEADLLQQIALSGQASISTDTLALTIAARCHEEARVWAENFGRAHSLTLEESLTQREFYLRR